MMRKPMRTPGSAYDNAGNPSLAREAYTKFLAKDPGGDLAPLVKEVMSGKAKAPTAEDSRSRRW